MKRVSLFLFAISICLSSFNNAMAANYSISSGVIQDSIPAQTKEEKRAKAKKELKESGQRLFVRVNYVYAKLNTTLTFDLVNSIFSANINLESDFKLPDTRLFFTGNFIYRFTHRSGIYVAYYGITRKTTFTTEKDYIFLGHTIPTGINGEAYFDTRVLSAGYLLTILQKEHAFLGAYFNVYVMNLSTGFKGEHLIDIDANLGLTLPLPSFGLAAIFPVTDWFKIHANVGYFGLSFEELGGSISNFELAFEFKPIHWLGLNVSYQSFDINVHDIQDGINFIADYNFRGPALGVSVNF